jgi:hypothetical protein
MLYPRPGRERAVQRGLAAPEGRTERHDSEPVITGRVPLWPDDQPGGVPTGSGVIEAAP